MTFRPFNRSTASLAALLLIALQCTTTLVHGQTQLDTNRGDASGAAASAALSAGAFDVDVEVPPRHQDLLRDLSIRPGHPWQARIGSTVDIFPDRDAWVESHLSLGRATPIGALAVRGARAERFGLTDTQLEVEMAPHIGSGTWFYLAASVARDSVLYPERRYAVDFHQSLGGGVEGAVGFRRVEFANAIDIYTAAISSTVGNWVLAGRLFHSPSVTEHARSLHASVRRYVGSQGSYIGLNYGHGAWPNELRTVNDVEVFDSDEGEVDAAVVLNDRLDLRVSGALGHEDRADRSNLRKYSLSVGLGVRF